MSHPATTFTLLHFRKKHVIMQTVNFEEVGFAWSAVSCLTPATLDSVQIPIAA